MNANDFVVCVDAGHGGLNMVNFTRTVGSLKEYLTVPLLIFLNSF
jgi:uncharacterized membrane protein